MEGELMGRLAQSGAGIYKGAFNKRSAQEEAAATEQAAAVEAAGLRMRADTERMEGQRQGWEQQQKTDKVISRQVALAAASGGGAGDATILDLIGDTAQRGKYLSESEKAAAESRARGDEDKARFGTWKASTQARALRQKGNAGFTGSFLEGASVAGPALYKYGKRRAGAPTSDDETDKPLGFNSGWDF